MVLLYQVVRCLLLHVSQLPIEFDLDVEGNAWFVVK